MGAQAYTVAGTLVYGEGEVIVEVGSERGEGSTAYLAGLGPTVWSIDIDHRPEALAVVPHPERQRVHTIEARAEDWLRGWDQGPVRYAWLDGHDWPYDGQPVSEANDYERLYRSRGQVYSREASALSHLRIAQLLDPWVPVGGVVGIDDTWHLGEGRWDGKGRSAVPWMVTFARYFVHQLHDGAVSLVKEPPA